MKKAFKRIILGSIVFLAVGFAGFQVWLSKNYTVPILMYHDIEVANPPKPNSVSAESFAYQMDFLKRHKYNVISLTELVDGLEQNKEFPRNTVVITFDDGHYNNYTEAFPVLKKHGFPATAFVPPEQIGTRDQEYTYMTWEQLKEMNAAGFTVESHMWNQAYIPSLTEDEMREQMLKSKLTIEQKLGRPVHFLAYPNGGFTEEAKKILKQSGYRAGLTTNRGFVRYNKDLYELKRIRISDDNRAIALWAKLLGFYNRFRSLRAPCHPSELPKTNEGKSHESQAAIRSISIES